MNLGNLTGTTNYLISDFNTKSKDRCLYYSGAVPLHQFVRLLVEFVYTYLNRYKKDCEFFISAICKPEGESRPDTPCLVRFNSSKDRSNRLDIIKTVIDDLIRQLDDIFEHFVETDKHGIVNKKDNVRYREDCPPMTIVNTFKEYQSDIRPKLLSIVDKEMGM